MKTPHLLAWLGVIPFTITLIATIIGRPLFDLSGNLAFAQYSLAILCFMAGTLWGQVISKPDGHQTGRVLIASNILTLLAFFTYLIFPITTFLFSAFVIFLTLLMIEAYLGKNRSIVMGSYWSLRVQVTSVVCVHHLIMILI